MSEYIERDAAFNAILAAIQRGRTIDEILERERKHGNLSA